MIRFRQPVRHIGWAVALICLWEGAALGAGPYASEGPMVQTQEILQSSNVIVTGEGDRDAKLVQLKVLLRDFLDTDALGRRSMGKHLEGVTPAQEQRFLSLFFL